MVRSTGTTQSLAVTPGRALTLVLALLGFLAAPRSASAQLSVDELEVFLRPGTSGQTTGVIRVTNDTDKAVQAMLEVQDWNRDEGGANHFHPLGSTKGTCRDKVKVFPASLRIDAHRTEPVRITYEGDAAGSCWAIVFLQTNEPPKASSTQSQITYVIRTGVKVYVEPETAKREGDVDSVSVVQLNASPTDSTKVPGVSVLFHNTGQAHLKPNGAVEVRSADNQVVAKMDISEFPIAPGDTRRINLALPNIKPGRYIALALLDYGGTEIAAGQLEFEIK
jgi:P pilus assembly chaperone PapD